MNSSPAPSTRMARAVVLSILSTPTLMTSAHAHGFGKRFDLPIPLDFYLFGAAATVALSFVLVALFVRGGSELHRYPRFDLLRLGAGGLLGHSLVVSALRVISVLAFLTLVCAGLWGVQSPARNIVPTFVWIIWWTGLAYVSALLGDFWALINPWQILYSWAESGYRKLVPAGRLGVGIPYPKWLGVWPAFVLFLVFVWGELVWENNAIPQNLAYAIIAYSCVTWIGMLIFGRHQWLRAGEAFSVAFGLLAKFAPSEVRVVSPEVCRLCSRESCRLGHDCVNCYECAAIAREEAHRDAGAIVEWNLRPLGVGLLNERAVSSSQMAFVLLMLATVSFDGFMATPLWKDSFDAITSTRALMPLLHQINMLGMSVDSIVATIGLMLAPLVFLVAYLTFSSLTALAARLCEHDAAPSFTTSKMARDFVLSLVPIAIAYHLAHYLTFLFVAGQLIIVLVSDPFGFGWDLFGTANYRVNVGLVGARFAWYASVASVITGHVIAVYLSHAIALRTFESRRAALISQFPMLALMVFYTFAGLWILAQPMVE